MATLSTLELMLHEIQNRENLVDHGKLPVLPQRPVSKARMPTGRARRAVLSLHLQKIGGTGKKKDEFVDGMIKRDGFAFANGGLLSSNYKDEMKNEGEEKAKKGIIVIQKYFRGYQARFHYHKLKDGIITLQSFVRGENARRKFQNSTKKLTQTHIHHDFVWKPLRTREATIIYLQSVVRSWLNRKHIDYIEDPTIENNKEANEIPNEIVESKEQVKVSQSYIRDLEQEVLRVETALQHKKHENYILELQIQQIDKKRELHKAKMSMKEKSWQDEFTSIQMSIASTQEKTMNEITYVPQKTTRQENGNKNITIRQILERQESGYGFQVDNKLNSRKGQEQELRKLKGRFKAWKKEFKTRLHDVKRTLDRFDHCRTQRVHKSCFVS